MKKKLLSICFILTLLVTCLFQVTTTSAANEGDTFNDFRASLTDTANWIGPSGSTKLIIENDTILPCGKLELNKIYYYNKKFKNFDIEFEMKADVKINTMGWLGAIAIRDKMKTSMYANDTVGMNIYMNLDPVVYQTMARGQTIAAPRLMNVDDINYSAAKDVIKGPDYADGKWHKIKIKLTDSGTDKVKFYYSVDKTVLVNNIEYPKVADTGYFTMFLNPGAEFTFRAIGGAAAVTAVPTPTNPAVGNSSSSLSINSEASLSNSIESLIDSSNSSSDTMSEGSSDTLSNVATESDNYNSATSSDGILSTDDNSNPENEKPGNFWIIIGAIIVFVIAGGLASYFLIFKKKIK